MTNVTRLLPLVLAGRTVETLNILGCRRIPALLLSLASISAYASETVTYYYTNQQGTPLATADASGNILSTADYRPYGTQVLGATAAGPGYTGHVTDPASGFVYMQARYYDPAVGRFSSVDPKLSSPGDLSTFGRYNYANNNPVVMVDPDGRVAQLYWTANNQVTYVVVYHLDTSSTLSPVSAPAIEKAIHDAFSRTVSINGTNVTVDAHAIKSDGSGKFGSENTVKVVPDTQGVTFTGRAETSSIGGDVVTVGAGGRAPATPGTFGHELGGHAGGAEDLYKGGRALDGSVRTQTAPGASGIMLDGQSPASEQSVRQILNAPTNTNVCAPDVHAATGGC
ncbi:RHS repeat-associated core domain-containing protein [Luteibacter sp. RCC_6_2]|uniref:RHS repeat-associated core domain-containing protein n=1 Tax=Luteibacter sp. RCC_6_2 TaxID=3239223 RepID=UPI003524ABA5